MMDESFRAFILSHMNGEPSPAQVKLDEKRSVDRIADSLLETIAEKITLSGAHQDTHASLIKVTRYAMAENEFRMALDTVAEHILKLFPKQ